MKRRVLLKGAAALFLVRDALAQGRLEKGVYRLQGEVQVNGAPAQRGAELRAGDTVRAQRGSEIVFVSARDAFMVRENTEVSLVANGLRIVTGAVLSVFASGERKEIRTPTANIGIRGTGIYIEVDPSRTYACTCYGETVLAPASDPSAAETVRTSHHESPRYIMPAGSPQMLMQAPVLNHTDAELILLESLVGRQPPFIGTGVRPYQ
jgi:hypothetical protein